MTERQKQGLIDAGVEYEWILDGFTPREFKKYPGFGVEYVKYIRELRGININPVRNLLDEEEESSDITAPPYERQRDTYHPLESGLVDVRVTLTLSAHQARWLDGLALRLPKMYPNNPEYWNLGFMVAPWIMKAAELDSGRKGTMAGSEGVGTMSKAQLAQFRSGQ